MCIKAAEVGPWQLKDISDSFKMQEMCDKVVTDRGLFFAVCP